jgi:hypothetical protein
MKLVKLRISYGSVDVCGDGGPDGLVLPGLSGGDEAQDREGRERLHFG